VTITIAPEAVDDLEATVEHIAAHNPRAAAGLARRVFDMIDRLAEGILDGPEQELTTGERARSWPVPPLRIYYQREPGRLIVLRIYHQARKPIVR
jgi:plasmid stabilization system protein ParE